MQKVLLVAVAILFALGVLTSYQKHILDYRVSAITEIEFGQASAIEHREYLLRSCQSGVWKSSSLGSFQRTYGNSACGEHGVSKAVCPSGQRVISGGWTLSGWSGNDGRNAPDSSQPISENTWQIVTGGGNSGGQCLRAVAYCADN